MKYFIANKMFNACGFRVCPEDIIIIGTSRIIIIYKTDKEISKHSFPNIEEVRTKIEYNSIEIKGD